ncbi:EF-hand domain-containing family member B-like [Anticarsia gemmatalis]|uniref:EF-hand domain-containing family member B-like n=1 Tax=Anticarsia gemmatalis TaxID=129554 RepID=UPI003F76690F
MPIECRKATTGGKGNRGMFIERDPDIVAAGLPTAQQNNKVDESLQHYLLKDETDALLSDAIIPFPKERPLPPLRKPIPKDMRYAGPFGHVAQMINPPASTKFRTLVNDFKDTMYKSYWKAPLGRSQDPTAMLPEGFDMYTTFGKPTAFHGRLYDVVMPKVPYPDNTPESKEAGYQLDRKYCAPPYIPDVTYGHRTFVDKRGTYARCCLTDDRVILGTAKSIVFNDIQSNMLDVKVPRVGKTLAPNNNISEVPEGYTFGKLKPPDNLPECLALCHLNKGLDFSRKCLKHLNTLRKCLSSRYLPTFFHNFYLSIKYYDKEKTGWLCKDIVYRLCGNKLIRFDPELIEPLLEMWNAFDGSKIEYKTFVRVINYREPSPEMPKIPDVLPDCLDYRTTYTEMVKPGQVADGRRMAGLPSGRYFDLDYPITPERCVMADRTCLLQESDVKSCIAPSILTKQFVSHRHMYEKQEPANVRRVFEATGEKFTDERFDMLWAEAQKLHSQGWVCYETFRRTLENNPESKTTDSAEEESK